MTGLDTTMTASTRCIMSSGTSSAPSAFRIVFTLGLLQECIYQNVGIHFLAVFDFVSPAAAAAVHRSRIVQAIGRINQNDFAADGQAEQLCVLGFGIESRNVENGAEYRMAQRNLL